MFGKYFGRGILALFLYTSAFSAAPVEESRSSSATEAMSKPGALSEGDDRDGFNSEARSISVTDDNPDSRLSTLFYQIQLLQEEVSSLRGLVEEQAFRIEQMGREQASRYADLDRRLYEIRGSDNGLLLLQSGGADSDAEEPLEGSETEEQSYRAAFKLVREKRFDDAISALKSFIIDYPNGQFTPNAFYWLGEVYLVLFQDQLGDSRATNTGSDYLENARQYFVQIVTLYPDHSKVPDALYKLGTVYHQLGNTSRALDYLDRVINTYPAATAAGLARSYSNELR